MGAQTALHFQFTVSKKCLFPSNVWDGLLLVWCVEGDGCSFKTKYVQSTTDTVRRILIRKGISKLMTWETPSISIPYSKGLLRQQLIICWICFITRRRSLEGYLRESLPLLKLWLEGLLSLLLLFVFTKIRTKVGWPSYRSNWRRTSIGSCAFVTSSGF